MSFSRLLVVLIIVVVLAYVGFHIYGLFAPPPLDIFSPEQGLTTLINNIEVRGKTAPGAVVEINGSSIAPPQSGEFRHLLVLDPGVNNITISARKRYGKPAVIERQVLILQTGSISKK